MPRPERPVRTWPSRPGLWAAGMFGVLIAVALVVALSTSTRAAPGGSQGNAFDDRTAQTRLRAMATKSASPGLNRPLTVVGIGDSVTSGSNCDCKTFVELYASDLAAARGLQTSFVNLGVAGWTSSQMLQNLSEPGDFRDQVAKADILLVTIGANDLVPLETKQSGGCTTTCYSPLVQSVGHNIELIVAAARAGQPSHRPTILVTNYWNAFEDGDVGTAENGAAFQLWSDTLTRAAGVQICAGALRAGATCVDLYAPFKGDGTKNPTSLLANDGDHPSSTGHQLIAATLLANTPPSIP